MLSPISEIPNARVVTGRARSKIRLIGSKKMRIATTPNVLSSIPVVFVSNPSASTFKGKTSARTPCENIRKKAPANARTIPGLRNRSFTRKRFVWLVRGFRTYVNERRTKNARIANRSIIPPLTAMMNGVLVLAATIPPYAGPKIAANPTNAPETATFRPSFGLIRTVSEKRESGRYNQPFHKTVNEPDTE